MNKEGVFENPQNSNDHLLDIRMEELFLNEKAFELYPNSDYIIVTVVSGVADLFFEELQLSVPPNCFIILDNRKKYVLKSHQSNLATVLIIRIPGCCLHEVWQTQFQNNEHSNHFEKIEVYTNVYTLIENNLGNSIIQLIKWRYKEAIDLGYTKKVSAPVIIKELLQLYSYPFTFIQRIPTKNKAVARNIFYNLLKAKLLILCHLKNPVNIHKMARAANISEAHFARYFKILFKVPPARYQILARTDKAAELLRRTSLPISDIAVKNGFENLSSFSRNFKKVYGQSPSDYRTYNSLPEYLNKSTNIFM